MYSLTVPPLYGSLDIPSVFLFPFSFGLYFIPQGRNTYVAFFELSAIGSLSLKIVSASYLRPHSSTV